jgi:hypothetical protein
MYINFIKSSETIQRDEPSGGGFDCHKGRGVEYLLHCNGPPMTTSNLPLLIGV